jgi:hypothetical protein
MLKRINYKNLFLMVFGVLFSTYLLYSMNEGNMLEHIFGSGVSFGIALMCIPNIINDLEDHTEVLSD